MLCPSCNRRNRDTASYCRECGTGLTTPCSKCGKEIPAGARFCDFCCHPAPGDAGSTASQGPVRRTPTGKETSDTLEFLSNLSMFQCLDREVLESLEDQMRLVSLPEGPIFKENEPVDGLYMIKSGVAKVTKSADVGAPEAVLAILRQGESFGEIGLIDDLPRSADVTAMQPMECYTLDREVFFEVLERHPEMARSMLKALATMVRNADQWVARTI